MEVGGSLSYCRLLLRYISCIGVISGGVGDDGVHVDLLVGRCGQDKPLTYIP